ncbi:Fic family protein [Nocardia carnea]|uniref:Fic family protein n=1 Tax=Nocardia carnea TaxID=37328 RepID=UPI0024562DA9|nr:Fic family protein [Nocardia carnea]
MRVDAVAVEAVLHEAFRTLKNDGLIQETYRKWSKRVLADGQRSGRQVLPTEEAVVAALDRAAQRGVTMLDPEYALLQAWRSAVTGEPVDITGQIRRVRIAAKLGIQEPATFVRDDQWDDAIHTAQRRIDEERAGMGESPDPRTTAELDGRQGLVDLLIVLGQAARPTLLDGIPVDPDPVWSVDRLDEQTPGGTTFASPVLEGRIVPPPAAISAGPTPDSSGPRRSGPGPAVSRVDPVAGAAAAPPLGAVRVEPAAPVGGEPVPVGRGDVVVAAAVLTHIPDDHGRVGPVMAARVNAVETVQRMVEQRDEQLPVALARLGDAERASAALTAEKLKHARMVLNPVKPDPAVPEDHEALAEIRRQEAVIERLTEELAAILSDEVFRGPEVGVVPRSGPVARVLHDLYEGRPVLPRRADAHGLPAVARILELMRENGQPGERISLVVWQGSDIWVAALEGDTVLRFDAEQDSWVPLDAGMDPTGAEGVFLNGQGPFHPVGLEDSSAAAGDEGSAGRPGDREPGALPPVVIGPDGETRSDARPPRLLPSDVLLVGRDGRPPDPAAGTPVVRSDEVPGGPAEIRAEYQLVADTGAVRRDQARTGASDPGLEGYPVPRPHDHLDGSDIRANASRLDSAGRISALYVTRRAVGDRILQLLASLDIGWAGNLRDQSDRTRLLERSNAVADAGDQPARRQGIEDLRAEVAQLEEIDGLLGQSQEIGRRIFQAEMEYEYYRTEYRRLGAKLADSGEPSGNDPGGPRSRIDARELAAGISRLRELRELALDADARARQYERHLLDVLEAYEDLYRIEWSHLDNHCVPVATIDFIWQFGDRTVEFVDWDTSLAGTPDYMIAATFGAVLETFDDLAHIIREAESLPPGGSIVVFVSGRNGWAHVYRLINNGNEVLIRDFAGWQTYSGDFLESDRVTKVLGIVFMGEEPRFPISSEARSALRSLATDAEAILKEKYDLIQRRNEMREDLMNGVVPVRIDQLQRMEQGIRDRQERLEAIGRDAWIFIRQSKIPEPAGDPVAGRDGAIGGRDLQSVDRAGARGGLLDGQSLPFRPLGSGGPRVEAGDVGPGSGPGEQPPDGGRGRADGGSGAPPPPGRLPGGDDSWPPDRLVIGRTADFDGVEVVGARRVSAETVVVVERTVRRLIEIDQGVLVGVRFEELAGDVLVVVRDGWLVVDPRAEGMPSERSGSGSSLPLLLIEQFGAALIAKRDSAVGERPEAGEGPADRVAVPPRARPAEGSEVDTPVVAGPDSEVLTEAQEDTRKARVAQDAGVPVEGYRGRGVPVDTVEMLVPVVAELVARYPEVLKGVRFAELPVNDREFSTAVLFDEALWDARGEAGELRDGWLVLDPRVVGLPVSRTAADMRLPEFVTRQFAKLLITRRSMGQPTGEVVEATRRGLRDVGVKPAPKREWKSFARMPLEQALEEAFVRVERDGQRMEDPSFPYYRALVEDRDTPVDLGRERRLWGAAQAAGVPEPSRVPPGQWPEVITGLRAELDNAAMENAARGLDPHALNVAAGLHEDRVGRFAALFELVHGRPPRPDEVPRLVGESEQGSRPAVREERARHGIPENRSPSRSSTSIPPVRDPGGGEVGDATSGGGDGRRTEAGSPLEARPLVAADREGGQVVRSERRSNNVLLVRRDGSVPDAAGDRGPGAPLPPGRLPGGDDSESSNGLIIGRTADFDGVAVVGASRVPAAMWDAVVRTVEGLIANYPDVLVGVRFEELERGVPGVVREGVLVLDPRAAEPVSELVVRLFADALVARPVRPRGGAGSVVERATGELAGEPVGGRDAEASSAAGELGAREQLVASIGFRVEGYQDVPLDALREWVPMLNRLVGQSQDATKGVLFELPAEPGHGVPEAEEGDGAPAFVRAGWLVVDPRQLHVLRYAESHEQLARRFESELRTDRSGWERQVHGLPDGDADAVAEVGDRRPGTQGAEDPVVVRRADESASGSDEPVAAGEPDVLVATTVLARMGGDAGPVGGVMWARLQAVEAVRSLWEAGDPRFAEAYARLRRMEVVAGRLSAMLLSDARLLSEPGTGSGPLGTRAEVAATVSRLMIEMNALLANPIFTTGAEYSGVSSGVAMRVLHDLWGSALVVPDPAAAHGLPGGPELIPWMERIGASAVVWQAGNAWVATVQGGRAFRFDAEQYSWVPLDAGADLSGAKGVFLDGRGRLLDPPGSEGAGEVGDGGPPGAGPGNGGLSVRPPFAGEPEAAGPAVVRLRDPHGDVSLVSRDGSMPVTGGDGRRQGPGPAPDPLSVDDPTPDRLDASASGSVEPIAAERGRTAPAESEEPSIRRRLEAAGVRIEGDPQVCARMLEAVGAVVERLVFRYPGVLRALLFGSLPQDGADAASIAGEGRLVLDPHAVPLSEAGRREQVTRRFGALLASHAENAVRRAHSFADSLRKQLREAGEERAGRNEWRRYRRMSLPEAVVEAFEYVEKNGFDLGHPSAAYYRALVGDAASALDFPREQRLWRLAVEAGVHDPHRLNSAGLARELVTLLDRLDADSDRLTEELPNMPGSVAAIVAGMHNDRVERYAALYQMIHGIPPRLFETPAEIRGFDNAAFRSGVSDGEESPWKQEAEALADERAADLGTRTRAELLVLASLFIDKKHLDIAVVAGQARPERLYGLREWAGFLDALAYARAHRGRDLSVPFLLELHRRLTPAYESQIGGVLTDSDRYALMTEPLTEQQKLALDANPYVSFNSRYRLDGAQGRLTYPNFPLENTALPGSDRQESFLQALCDWYNGVRRGSGDPYAIAAALQRILISVHPFGDFNGRLSRIVMNWALENAGLPPSALYDTNSDLFVSPQEWAASVRAGSMRYERLLSRARLLGQDADLVQLFGLEDLHRRYRHFDGRIAPFTEGDNLYGVLERLYRDLDEFFVEPEVHTRRETAEQPANSPEELLRGELRAKLAAVDRSSVDSLIAAFFGGYPRDEVTDFYDGRRSGFKSREVLRAQMTVAETNGLRAFYLSADIANLGGLNLFASLRGESANAHFRAITDIFRSVLEESGAAVVPMRVGGDELAAVLVGLDIATVEALRTETERRVAEYARTNGLSDIEHPKHPGRPAYRGVGMYLGYAEILPGASLGSVFDAADLGVDRSKNSRLQQYNAETPGRVVWSGRTDNPQVPEQNQAPGTADRPNSVEPEAIRSRPVRVRYPSPDEVRRDELRTELAAVDLDSDEAVLDVLFDAGGIDEVSQLLDGRASGVKTAELLRMLDYVARTGDSAHVIVAKMWNLGGLNQHFANQAEVTNHHFRRIAEIFRTVVEEAGGWAVPMRLEGPRLGANVAGIDPARIASVAATVEHRVREYAREHGLADIPHPKNPEDPGRRGVRLHVGYAEVRPGGNVAETFESAERRLSNGTRDAVARSAAVTVVVDERLARAPGAEVRSGQVIRYPGGSLAVVAEPGDHLRALARAARRDPDVARALADESVPLVQVEVPLFDGGQPRTSSLDRATLGPVEEPARTAAADLLPAPELPLRDRLAALADLDPAHARVVLEVVRDQVRDVLSERVREAFAMLGSAPPRYSVGDRGEVTDPVSAHPREVLAALRIAGVSDHMYEAVARSFAELRAVDQRIAWADADLVDWVRSVGNSPGPVVFRRPPADFAVCGQLAVVARNAWYHDVPGSVAVRLPDTSQNFAEPIEPAGFSWLVGGHAKYLVGGLAEAAALVSGAAKGQDFRSMDPAVRAGNSGRAVLVVRSGADEGKAAFVVNDEGTIKLIDLQNGTSTTLGEEVNGEGVWHGVELDSIGNPVDPIRWQSPDDDRAVPPDEATAVEARVLDRRLRLQVGIGGDGNPASDGTGDGVGNQLDRLDRHWSGLVRQLPAAHQALLSRIFALDPDVQGPTLDYLNEVLAGDGLDPSFFTHEIAVLDLVLAMRPLPEAVVVSTTLEVNPFGRIEGLQSTETVLTGYLRTVLGIVPYGDDTNPYHLEIAVPAGTPALLLGPLSPLGRYFPEIVLGRDLVLRIDAVDDRGNGSWSIRATVAPPVVADTPSNYPVGAIHRRDGGIGIDLAPQLVEQAHPAVESLIRADPSVVDVRWLGIGLAWITRSGEGPVIAVVAPEHTHMNALRAAVVNMPEQFARLGRERILAWEDSGAKRDLVWHVRIDPDGSAAFADSIDIDTLFRLATTADMASALVADFLSGKDTGAISGRIDDWLLLLQSRETLGPVVDAVMFVGPEGFALLPTAHWKLLEYTDDHPLPAHHPASTLRRLARLDYPLPGYPPEPGAEWQRTHGSRPLASVVVPLDVLRFAVVVEQDPVSKKWSLHEGPAGPAQEALVDRLGDESADSPQGMARLVAEHLNGGRLASAMPRFRGPLRDVAPAAPGTIPESAERSDTASSPGEGAIVRLALDTLAEEYENSGGAESPSAIVSLRRFDSAAAVVDRVDGTQLIIVGAVEGRHAETMRDLIRRHSNEFRWLQDAQGEVRHLLVRPDGEPVFLDPSVSDGRIRIPEPHQVHEAMVAAYLRSKDVVGIGIDSWVWRSLPVEFFVPKSGSVEGLPSGFLAPDALWRAIAVGGDVPPDHTSARVLRDLADFRLRIPAPPVREFSIMGPVELWVVTGALRFPVVVEYIEGGRWRLDPQSRGIAQDALVGEFGNIVARDPAKLMERLAAELVGGRVKAAPAEHPGSWPASASRPERVAELEHSIGLLADAVSPSSPELVADTYGSLAGRLEAELATLSGAQLIERHYSVRRRHGEAVARYREVLRVLELPDEVLLLDLTRDDSGGERVLAELRDRLRTIEAALRAAEQSGRYRELARQADIVGWYRAEYPRSGFAEPYWFPGQQVALIAAANSMRVAVVAVEGYHAVAEQRWREAVDPAALENLASGYWVVDWLSIRPDETGERVDRLDRIWREASGFDAMAPAIGVARLTAEAEALRAKIDMLEGPLEQRYRTVREPVLIQQRFAELAARSGENTDSGTAGTDTGAGAPAHHNAAVAAVVDALVVVVGGAAQVVAGQVLRISDEQGSLSVIAEPGDHLRALARAARSDPAIARVLQGAPAPIVWVEVPVDGTAERRVTVTDGPVAAPFGRPIDRSAETFFPPDAGSLRDRLAALTDLDPVHARVALEVVRGQISDALSVRLREVFPAASQYAIGDRGEVVDVVAAQPARTLEAMRRIGVPEHIYAAVEAGFAELRALERHIASVEADLAVWLRGAVSSSGPVRWGQSALFREPPAGFNLCGQLLVVAHNAWYHDVPGSRPMRLPATPVDPGETIAPPAFSWMIGAHAESLPRGYAEALEWVSGAEPGQDHRSVAPEVRTSSSGRGMIMFEDGGGETAAFLIVNDAGTVRVIDLGAGYIGPPADPIDTSGRWHGARLDRRGVPVDPIASDLAVELPVVDKTFRLLEGIGGSAGKDPIGTGDSGIPAETAMPYPASPRDTVAVPDTSGAVEFDSPESVRAYADEHWGHGAEHRRLLDIYITEGSAINRYLRGDTGWRDSTMKPWAAADVDAIVEQLRSVMAPLPDAVVVRRYVDARFISGLRRGDIVPESAFISTIADPEPPFFLEHSTGILTLTVPAGVPVAFLRNGFNELLLTDGLSWRVIDSVTSDDETAVQVRGIVDWDPPPVEPPVRHGKPPEPDTGAVHDHETPVAEPATGVADRPVAAPAPLSPQRAEAVRAGIAGLGEQVRADAGRRELRETLEAMLSREQSAAVHLADSYDRAEVRADEYIGSIYAMDDRVAEIRRLLRMVGVDVADEIQRSLIPRPADHEPSDIPFADRHLEARAQSEPTVTVLKLPGDGQLFRVELHTFDDGWQVIAKVVHSEPAADPERLRRDLDAEELGALVGRTVGGPFPRVHRMDDALYMEFVDGPDALAAWKAVAGPTRLLGGTDEEIAFPYLNSADGRLIGFVDWLIGNGDRNAANWIINQWDRIVGIDHEMTFGYRRLYSYFAVGMKAHLPLFGPDWIDPVAPMRDFAGMRQRLGGLLPEFEARGRGDWHRAMMARLDELERTAVDYGRLRLSWELEHAESRARVEDSLRRATADLPGRRVLLAEAMVAPEYTMQRLRTGGIPGELIAELAGNIGEYGKSTDRIELADGEAAGRLRTVEAETYALHRIGDERRKGVELAPGHVLGNPLDGMHPPNDANCVALAGFAINDFYHYVRNGRRAISNLAISVDLDGFPFEAVEWVMGGRLEGFADVRQARVRIARRLWSGNDDLPDGWPDADPDDGIDATTKSNNRMRGILVIEERLVEGKAVPGHAYFVGNRNGVLRLYDYGTRFIGEFDPRRNDSRVVSIHVIEFLPTGDPADPLFVDAEGRRVHPMEADPDAALPAPPVFRSPRVRKLLDIGSPPPEGFETTGVPDGPEGDTGRGAEPLIRQGRPTVDLSITDPNPMEIVLHKLGERVADVSVLIDRGAGIAALGAEVRAGQRRSVLVPEDALRYLREQPGWSAPRDGEGARLVNDSLSATTRWDGGPRLSDALARSWQQPGGLLRIASLPDVYAVLQERGRPQDLLFAGDIRAHLHDPRRAPLPPHILARYMDMMRAIMSEAALAHPDADVAIRLAAGGLHTTYTLYGGPDIGRFNQIIGGLEQPRFLVPAAYHNGFGLLADGAVLQAQLRRIGARPDEQLDAAAADTASDAVYGFGRRSDNPLGYDELLSARLLRAQALALGYPRERADRLYNMVMGSGFDQATKRQVGKYDPDPLVQGVTAVDLFTLVSTWAMEDALAIAVEDLTSARFSKGRVLGQVLAEYNLRIRSLEEAMAILDTYGDYRPIIDGERSEKTLRRLFIERLLGNQGFTLAHEFPPTWQLVDPRLRQINAIASKAFADALARTDARGRPIFSFVQVLRTAKEFGHRMEQLFGPYGFERV